MLPWVRGHAALPRRRRPPPGAAFHGRSRPRRPPGATTPRPPPHRARLVRICAARRRRRCARESDCDRGRHRTAPRAAFRNADVVEGRPTLIILVPSSHQHFLAGLHLTRPVRFKWALRICKHAWTQIELRGEHNAAPVCVMIKWAPNTLKHSLHKYKYGVDSWSKFGSKRWGTLKNKYIRKIVINARRAVTQVCI